MDTKGKLTVLSRKRGVFMDTEVENKKRYPRKDVQRNADVTKRRFSAASSALARCSKNIAAAGTPGPTEVRGRHAPNRGCLSEAKTGVKIALNYLFKAVATSTAQATVQPTIGLLPIPRNPIIST